MQYIWKASGTIRQSRTLPLALHCMDKLDGLSIDTMTFPTVIRCKLGLTDNFVFRMNFNYDMN